jgi:hypothetical protein
MKHPWPTEALAFRESVAGSLERLGGIEFARECEADPALREDRIAPTLSDLSFDELDPQRDAVEAAAASLGLRAAGGVLCAWPLAAQLSLPSELRERYRALYLVNGDPGRLEHLDLATPALVLNIATGEAREVAAAGDVERSPLDPFGVPCTLGPAVELAGADRAIGASVVLTAYWVLGALDRVARQVAAYAAERHQFGKPIASFGGIQWHLSDLAVAHAGLDELAGFTLMRFGEDRATRADVLALRLATLESANTVLAHAHQILGAIGLCEEHDATVVDRHLQPSLRRSGGAHATTALLAAAVADSGFDAIHPIRARDSTVV